MDSIQIQFFKMIIASKLDSQFNSTSKFHLNSIHNSILLSNITFHQLNSKLCFERWAPCFLTNITFPHPCFTTGDVWSLVPTDVMQNMLSKAKIHSKDWTAASARLKTLYQDYIGSVLIISKETSDTGLQLWAVSAKKKSWLDKFLRRWIWFACPGFLTMQFRFYSLRLHNA